MLRDSGKWVYTRFQSMHFTGSFTHVAQKKKTTYARPKTSLLRSESEKYDRFDFNCPRKRIWIKTNFSSAVVLAPVTAEIVHYKRFY